MSALSTSTLRLIQRHRKLAVILLSIPAALTALLWIASHLWFIWYCSLPPNTLIKGKTTPTPCTKVRILAGAIHYTDDVAHDRDLVSRMNTGRPLSPGTMSLGTMYDGTTGMANSGLSIHWSPYSFSATRWKPQLDPGNWGFPLAIPFTIFLLPPLTFYLLTRPRLPGLCPHCNYNRTGIPITTPCPECGKLSNDSRLPLS